MTQLKPIHTLDARDHSMLEVMRDYFQLSTEQMHRQIQLLRAEVETILDTKKISYDKLRSALVPDQHRRDIALVFDTLQIDSSWYGYEVFEQIIPLLEPKSNHSILVGDYLDRPKQSDLIYEAFCDAVAPRRHINFRHPTQFYIVYINNLSDAMVAKLDEGLQAYQPYVGIADMTYASRFKILLSTMLVNLCLKHGRMIIQPHEPDRSNDENINMSGYPFEESGYKCVSLSEDIFGVLLSYKIERPVFQGFEADTEMSLASVHSNALPIEDFDVQVDEAKMTYLKSMKTDSIERAGIADMTSQELADLIRSKVADSYIYNLATDTKHGVTKFNVMLETKTTEGKPSRHLAALEYQPDKKTLRLITLY
jgi:hypothetical protein